MSGLTVALADDHHAERERLRSLLHRTSGITVAESGTGPEAVEEVVRRRPDVLLIDPRSGFAAVAEVVRSAPGTSVLVFTEAGDSRSVRAALRSGARGYLLKPAEPARIVQAITTVAKGAALFDASVACFVTALFTGSRPTEFSGLTTRQREVLELMAAGLPNAAIARRLQLNPKTVRNHVSALFAGLGVPDRAQAITVARDAGLATSLGS